jgi:pyrimidine deaminase RibD-like protein
VRLGHSPLLMNFQRRRLDRVTRVAEQLEEWKAITPSSLIPPVEHIRKMFDEGVWKCSQVTEKLCFAELHPDDKHIDLDPYRSAFARYRKIIGLEDTQQFDHDYQLGTSAAIFHAFLQVLSAGIRSEVLRLFKDLLQIGIANSVRLKEHPVEWAKTHLRILLDGNTHVVKLWIKAVCDKQDVLKPDQDFDELIFWRSWRAPKLIYMQPSGNLPYDPSTAWSRERDEATEKLLGSLSDRFIQSLRFALEKIAGDAHVELAKTGAADDDRRFALMAIEEALKSVPEDEKPHPKVGAVVVKNGQVLSRAHRGEILKSHAEYIALDEKLSDDLIAGATVYTTLEPCTTRNHPKIPCAQRLIDRKVARVVVGMLDPNPNIRGLGDQRLSEAGIEIQLFPRDLRAQVEEMNREFTRAQKDKQPSSSPSDLQRSDEARTRTEQLKIELETLVENFVNASNPQLLQRAWNVWVAWLESNRLQYLPNNQKILSSWAIYGDKFHAVNSDYNVALWSGRLASQIKTTQLTYDE